MSSFGDIRGLDPANIADGLVSTLHQLLFAGLVDFDDKGEVVPRLAERFERSADGLTYRFYLRKGVLFHDGTELTADDVKRSIERALHPSAPNPYASFYASIRGYDAFAAKTTEDLEGVRVDGTYVVSIALVAPDSTFLPLLAMHVLRPVCKSGGKRYTDTFHPCGTGPFKLPEGGWVRGQSVSLVRHDGYFEPGKPYLDGVVFTVGMTISAAKYKFLNGELDTLRDLTQADILAFQRDPRWEPQTAYDRERQIMGEAMNTELPPFDNVEVRRAVAAALDRTHYEKVKPTTLRAATQPIPPGTPGFDASVKGQTYDLGAALEHMKRAGYPYDPATKTGGYPHVIPYYTYRQGVSEYTAQIFAQEVAKIGLRIELRLVNYPTYLAQIGRRGKVPVGPWGWSEDYPDAIDFLESMFHTKGIADEDASNVSFYASPTFDALVDRAKRELDPGRRKDLVSEAVTKLCEDAPFAFAYSVRFFDVHQGYVRAYHQHPVWPRDVAFSWLDRTRSTSAHAARLVPGRSPLAGLARQ
jgi:ABC-type transport system substrate-binding protein